MHIWISKAAASHKAEEIGLAAAILVASIGAVVADERFPPNQYYGPYENSGPFVKRNPGLARHVRIATTSFARERAAAKVWARVRYIPKVQAMFLNEA